MIKKTELLIVKADAASGDERMLLRESYDADSIKRLLMSIAARIGRDPEDMKKMTMSMDARTDIDVVDGMTRAMHRMSTTRNNLMGDTVVITDRKNVTVSPAP